MILEEFDNDKNAIINPCNISKKIENIPKIAITCYDRKIIERVLRILNHETIAQINRANDVVSVYKITYKGQDFVFFMSPTGAPACIGILENIYEMGVEKVIMFGSCGVLDKTIKDCAIIIPTSAIRDEGTSYHYYPVSDEISVNEKYIEKFKKISKEHNRECILGKTWTTDAIYRETKEKMKKRKGQGCICVDMECSAVSALAKFREKEVFQFFYAADSLDEKEWNSRSLRNGSMLKEKDSAVILALELGLGII